MVIGTFGNCFWVTGEWLVSLVLTGKHTNTLQRYVQAQNYSNLQSFVTLTSLSRLRYTIFMFLWFGSMCCITLRRHIDYDTNEYILHHEIEWHRLVIIDVNVTWHNTNSEATSNGRRRTKLYCWHDTECLTNNGTPRWTKHVVTNASNVSSVHVGDA